MSEPRKTSKARAAGVDPDPALTDSTSVPPAAPPPAPVEPVVPPPPAVAPAPAPAAEAAAPAQGTPGAPAPSTAPAAPSGPPPGAQVAAAISGVASTLKDRLSGPELLLGGGALLIAGVSFLLFQFLLGTNGGPSELAVVTAGALLVFIGLERMQVEGFGSWYKVILVLLGALLAMGAIYNFLFVIRHEASALNFGDWLAQLSWWVGGILAGAGSWAAYKVKR